ncbi:hypothetical protein BD779DRAFT_467003 [Infundibulicybe gibba]|nr:hypothetical protein BD779DRAFT_467003 [Infundibulicybe gibba]
MSRVAAMASNMSTTPRIAAWLSTLVAEMEIYAHLLLCPIPKAISPSGMLIFSDIPKSLPLTTGTPRPVDVNVLCNLSEMHATAYHEFYFPECRPQQGAPSLSRREKLGQIRVAIGCTARLQVD